MKRSGIIVLIAAALSACSGKGAGALCGLDTPDAGADLAVNRNALVSLSATSGSDPKVGFAWSVLGPDGQPATFDAYPEGFHQNAEIQFSASEPGVYVATVRATASNCGTSDPATVRITVTNHTPTAVIGYSQWPTTKGHSVQFSSNHSTDIDWDRFFYRWTITSAPAGSTAGFNDPTSDAPVMTPDIEGDYTIQLVVNDGVASSAPASVVITATDQPPTVTVRANQAAVTGAPAALTANGSDPDGDPLSYEWSLVSAPAGSDAGVTSTGAATIQFTPDQEGNYVLSVVAHDRTLASAPAQLNFNAYRRIAPLSHDVVAARFDPQLGKIVFASATPTAVELYDPYTEAEQTIALPRAPTSLALTPDGRTAAVGEDGFVSVVDLTALDAGVPFAVSSKIDSVAASAGAVYAMGTGGGFNYVYTVHPDAGTVGSNYSSQFGDGTSLALHPNGTALYAAHAYVMRLSFDRSQNAQYAYESGYSGSQTGGHLWFSADGGTLISDNGVLFHVDPNTTSSDLTYSGSLSPFPEYSQQEIEFVDDSAAAGELAVIPSRYSGMSDDDSTLLRYSAPYYSLASTVKLPAFLDGGVATQGYGRFVFHSADGTHLFVVVQQGSQYGASGPFGVVTY